MKEAINIAQKPKQNLSQNFLGTFLNSSQQSSQWQSHIFVKENKYFNKTFFTLILINQDNNQ